MFQLPPLPYSEDALAPYISSNTLQYHYGKHHKKYVDKLNGLVQGTDLAQLTLEDIILKSDGAIFNNAAQVWNHTFYWHCLSETHHQEPQGVLLDAINKYFDSYESFLKQFSEQALSVFGSGWCWLVVDPEDFSLKIVTTQNAGNPLTLGLRPILTCDVWEHAYYLDTQNQRPKYIENFWEILNWAFVTQKYQEATGST